MNLKSVKKVLLLGKSRAFSKEEFIAQMKYHNIELVQEFDEEVSLVVEGRMMTPYEQNISDELYENNQINALNINVLETELAKEIDEDTLLMSLKLSHDKERLKSFIENSCISDTLFFRLFKMYSWHGEDFFENDDNRDVSAAFIARFYENIERNHNVQFATTGFIHLVSQAKESQILEAMVALEPLKFHPKIKMAIAMSSYCQSAMQKRLYKLDDENIYEALSFNANLTDELVEKLLESEQFGKNIAKSIRVDALKFEKLLKFRVDLAKNQSLDSSMQERLFDLDEKDVNLSLSANSALENQLIALLLECEDEEIKKCIYANKATSVQLLEEAYENPTYHESLAQNENTPIDILYQLHLDSRYERFVKTNAGFGKHIQNENLGWL